MKPSEISERYKHAFKSLPAGITAAEASVARCDETALYIKDGEQADCSSFTSASLSVSVSKGESSGRVNSSNLDDDPLYLINKASESSNYVRRDRNIYLGREINVENPGGDERADELLAFGVALEKAARGSASVEKVTTCSVKKRGLVFNTVNSLGTDSKYTDNSVIARIGVRLNAGGERPAHAVLTAQAPWLSGLDPAQTAWKAVNKAKLTGADLEVVYPAAGVRDAVILSDVASSIMVIAWMELVGTHINRVSPVYPFDPMTVISYEKTAPDTWSNNARASERDGEITGGALRTPVCEKNSVNIVSDPSKLFIEPSGKSTEDLLKTMGTGFFVTEAYDVLHSVSASTGDFSIVCDGIVYESGEPASRFERMVMFGNLQDLFRNMADTDDDSMYREFMRKDYVYGSPGVLVRGVNFSGQEGKRDGR